MPKHLSNILKGPLEKSIKYIAGSEPFRYSKNVSNLCAKRVQADLFPPNSTSCQQMSFTLKPSKKYISFRQDCHLEVYAKILVNTTDENDVVHLFHLNEKIMNIYLNDGFSKFIKNVKCVFNNSVSLDTSTLSFQDLNVFEMYNAIETSFLKNTDEFKQTNLMLNDIISQFELSQIKAKIVGEQGGDIDNISSDRIFTCTLPIFPFRLYPSFYKHRLRSSTSHTPENLPTVCVFLIIKKKVSYSVPKIY